METTAWGHKLYSQSWLHLEPGATYLYCLFSAMVRKKYG